jgi:hypothetical protein
LIRTRIEGEGLMILRYRSFLPIEELSLNECTIHRASNAGRRWWNLWFFVLRETDGGEEAFVVPVAPGGDYTEDGPGGRTWGLKRPGGPGSLWEVSPSINVLDDEGARALIAGHAPTGKSLWHQNVSIEGVSDADTWTTGAPP